MPVADIDILDSSVCTDSPTGSDLFKFGPVPAQIIQNTGIERNGGISALYLQTTTLYATANYTANQSLIAKSGDLIQVDTLNNIRINGNSIGNVGPYAVSNRGAIKGYSDAAWSASNTIIAIAKIGQTIKVDEINPSTMAVINTRSTTFTMPSIAITNVILQKYIGMNYLDSLTFIVSNNQISYSLVEINAPGISIVGGQTWSSTATIGTSGWTSIAWAPSLSIFCAVGYGGFAGYASTSPDGITWTGRTLATNTWSSVAWSPSLNLFAAVAGNSATFGTSPDGITWTPRAAPSSDAWEAVCWSPQLAIFCAVGSGTTHYVCTSPDGITWAGRTASAASYRGIAWSATLGLFAAVSSTGASTSPDGINWTTRTLEANGWDAIAWSPPLSLFVAVGQGATHYAATSPDGINWTTRTLATAGWSSIVWSPGLSLFCAVANTGLNGSATSPDGINWTTGNLTVNSWNAVGWSPSLNRFVALGNTALGVGAFAIQTLIGTNFSWKFNATQTVAGNQGIGNFAVGNIAATMTGVTGTWAVIDIFNATTPTYSRAIISYPATVTSGTKLFQGIGEVGYNQTGTFTGTATYYGPAFATTTVIATVAAYVSGPGYSEAVFTKSDTGATATFYYQAPIMQHNPGQWYDYQQCNTPNLCLGYGRLTDFQGNSLGNTCSLRVGWVGGGSAVASTGTSTTTSGVTTSTGTGVPAFISAGQIAQDASYDALGVPITNIGEFDEFFMPHVVDNGSSQVAVIYRYNGVLFFVVITNNGTNTIQSVSDNIYMVNCLSPVNAIDIQNKTLNLGVNDYNGRILFRSSATMVATSYAVAGVMSSNYANSIDTGAKTGITQAAFSVASNIIPGIELPSWVDRAVPNYGVNIYNYQSVIAGFVYMTTYQSFSISYINSNFVGVTYVTTTVIPFAMGYTFYYHAMQTDIETVFTGVGALGSANIVFDYLGYEIGNDIPNKYLAFPLYGQQYIFDGNYVWLAQFNGSLFSGKGNAPIAPATGMQLIAWSPNSVYFVSSFDNALYIFNGGRSLVRVKRLNSESAILNGVYNVRDDSLLLNTASSFIWIRGGRPQSQVAMMNQAFSGIISINNKLAAQTNVIAYDTANGIEIANTQTKWIYSFKALAGSTVIPLVYQTAFYSLMANETAEISNWIVMLYSPAGPISASVALTCYSWDIDNYYTQADQTIVINPGDWDGLGYYRTRIQPQHRKAIALSLKITTNYHLVITDISIEYSSEGLARIAAKRSA